MFRLKKCWVEGVVSEAGVNIVAECIAVCLNLFYISSFTVTMICTALIRASSEKVQIPWIAVQQKEQGT